MNDTLLRQKLRIVHELVCFDFPERAIDQN